MTVNVNDWTHNTTTTRVAIPTNTTRRPGRRSHWTAQVGDWWAEDSTEQGALKKLAAGIAAFAQAYEPPMVVTYKGHTAVISASFNTDGDGPSWTVQMVGPNGPAGLMMTGGTKVEVNASARNSLTQRVTDWHDDTSVHEGAAFLEGLDGVGHGSYGPGEFYRYAAWQRAAKAAMDAGESDFHTWASEHACEFEVPRP